MNKIHGVKITKLIEGLIPERVTIISEPFRYKITGMAGGGYDTAYSAHSTWEKLKKWVEANGAEALLIQDHYQEIYEEALQKIKDFKNQRGFYPLASNRKLQKGQSMGYLIVEITDPVSYVIDKLLGEGNIQRIS